MLLCRDDAFVQETIPTQTILLSVDFALTCKVPKFVTWKMPHSLEWCTFLYCIGLLNTWYTSWVHFILFKKQQICFCHIYLWLNISGQGVEAGTKRWKREYSLKTSASVCCLLAAISYCICINTMQDFKISGLKTRFLHLGLQHEYSKCLSFSWFSWHFRLLGTPAIANMHEAVFDRAAGISAELPVQ